MPRANVDKRKHEEITRALVQQVTRDNIRKSKMEMNSLRFLKLLWLWSLGNQELMVHAWETQHHLTTDFCNAENLEVHELLEIVRSHLTPWHPMYEKDATFLECPQTGSQATACR